MTAIQTAGVASFNGFGNVPQNILGDFDEQAAHVRDASAVKR
jgi:hypothetical protein